MIKVQRALRALSILLCTWAALLAVGWAAGHVPPPTRPPAAEPERTGAGTSGSAERQEEPLVATKPPDAGARKTGRVDERWTPAVERPGPSHSEHAASRFELCRGNTAPVLLQPIRVLPQGVQLAIGCGTQVRVVAFRPGEEPMTPETVLTIQAENSVAHTSMWSSAVASGDVDADGLADLALSFVRTEPSGVPRGGEVYLVHRSSSGSFERISFLAPVSATDILLSRFDETAGLDPIVVHWADAHVRRPGELWFFRGSVSPERVHTRPIGLSGRFAVTVDLNRDGYMDVVSSSPDNDRIDLLFGDGRGAVADARQLEVEAADSMVVGDINGDGASDVVIAGKGVSLVTAATADHFSPRLLSGARDISLIDVVDIDGDGLQDLVALQNYRIVLLRQREHLTFELSTLASLPSDELPVALAIADFDEDGDLDLAIALRTTDSVPRCQITFLPNLSNAPEFTRRAHIKADPEVTKIQAAPLSLSIALRPS
ncbi:MAG: FG-GAP-like repeat-containing protein [Myxococcota bacterium]